MECKNAYNKTKREPIRIHFIYVNNIIPSTSECFVDIYFYNTVQTKHYIIVDVTKDGLR